MFDTSEEVNQKVSKKSVVDISDDDSEAEVNEFDVASQSLEERQRVRPMVTRQLFVQAENGPQLPERYVRYNIC